MSEMTAASHEDAEVLVSIFMHSNLCMAYLLGR